MSDRGTPEHDTFGDRLQHEAWVEDGMDDPYFTR